MDLVRCHPNAHFVLYFFWCCDSGGTCDHAGEDSWPLSYLSFATFFVNQTARSTCVPVQQFAGVLQWAFSNTQAGNDAATAGYAPLLPSFIRYVQKLFTTRPRANLRMQVVLTTRGGGAGVQACAGGVESVHL
jgi:hypothetical protein